MKTNKGNKNRNGNAQPKLLGIFRPGTAVAGVVTVLSDERAHTLDAIEKAVSGKVTNKRGKGADIERRVGRVRRAVRKMKLGTIEREGEKVQMALNARGRQLMKGAKVTTIRKKKPAAKAAAPEAQAA